MADGSIAPISAYIFNGLLLCVLDIVLNYGMYVYDLTYMTKISR